MIRVFIGYDPRAPLAYTVLQHSIIKNSSQPVAITPLVAEQLPIKRFGLTAFTFSRFLVPWLCDYKGVAIFMDADMVVTGDIADLERRTEAGTAVSVNQTQPEFEWPSVMLFNNQYCTTLTPEWVNSKTNNPFLLRSWAEKIGTFDPLWNHCVGYQEPKDAHLYHYTQGIPEFYETQGMPEDKHWFDAKAAALATCSWEELMGPSVHAVPVLKRMLSRYRVGATK